MKAIPVSDRIIKTLSEKSRLKLDLFETTVSVFNNFKEVLQEVTINYNQKLEKIDKRLLLEYQSKGDYEAQLKFAGDILIFHMHTNIFTFDTSHPLWKTSYVKEDNNRAFCGMITVYNFLADSFKYNRVNDTGYLIARLFMNHEKHYFVEGKKQMGVLYNDFIQSIFTAEAMRSFIESSVVYSMDFDLFTPPYETMQEVSLHEIRELQNNLLLKTGKRLGFKFRGDEEGD